MLETYLELKEVEGLQDSSVLQEKRAAAKLLRVNGKNSAVKKRKATTTAKQNHQAPDSIWDKTNKN